MANKMPKFTFKWHEFCIKVLLIIIYPNLALNTNGFYLHTMLFLLTYPNGVVCVSVLIVYPTK